MSKRIIAVNAGPRKGWNTDTLIEEAIKGAESAGAEVQKFDLFRGLFPNKSHQPKGISYQIPILLTTLQPTLL